MCYGDVECIIGKAYFDSNTKEIIYMELEIYKSEEVINRFKITGTLLELRIIVISVNTSGTQAMNMESTLQGPKLRTSPAITNCNLHMAKSAKVSHP